MHYGTMRSTEHFSAQALRTRLASIPMALTPMRKLAALVPLVLGSIVWFVLPGAAATPPHIMVIMMENQGYSQVMGSSAAPYMNSLASQYELLTNAYATSHPSLPNYLEVLSGGTDGVSTDCSPSSCGNLKETTFADQLTARGIPWSAYMEGMTGTCGMSNAGGSGGYAVRHDPFVYFASVASGSSCSHVVPMTGMLQDLAGATPPDFAFVSPTICDDAGGDAGCATLQAGDTWLSHVIPEVQATPWYADGGTIILTFDEGTSSDAGGQQGAHGGHVLTIVISQGTHGASSNSSYIDQAGILRSLEGSYGVPYLQDAGNAANGTISLTGSTSAPLPSATPQPTSVPTATPMPSHSPTPVPQATPPSSTGGSPQPLGSTSTRPWNLTFNSTFSGTTLNTAQWSTGWFGSGITDPVNQTSDPECYDPANVHVANGLTLSLTQHQEFCNGTRPYAASMITTRGKYTFTHGFIEAKIASPGVNGALADWPAFWADGASWPKDGELDVLEGLHGQACFHFHSPAGGPGGCASGNFTGWHTYGAEWTASSVTYYYDGHDVGTITTGITSSPMYIILSLAASGAYGGPAAVPAEMQVAYVRVWQHGASSPAPSSTPKPGATPTPLPSATAMPTPQPHCTPTPGASRYPAPTSLPATPTPTVQASPTTAPAATTPAAATPATTTPAATPAAAAMPLGSPPAPSPSTAASMTTTDTPQAAPGSSVLGVATPDTGFLTLTPLRLLVVGLALIMSGLTIVTGLRTNPYRRLG